MFFDVRMHLRTALVVVAGICLSLSGCSDPPTNNGNNESQQATFTVDDSFEPDLAEIPSVDSETMRPVAALTDDTGIKAHFVENELIVTGDVESAQALADRWNGEIIRSIDGLERTIESSDEEISIPAIHVLRVDASSADPSILGEQLKQLDERTHGEHRISSEEGRQLLTAAAMERNETELDVGVNWVFQGDDVSSRTTTESENSNVSDYTPNAFEWPYMNRGSAQDIGAGEAMRLLEEAGKTSNQVTVGIVDGGFLDSQDYPTNETYPADYYNVPNPGRCGPTNPCNWHGTHVAETALAVPDNGLGVAGPAGTFSDAIFMQGPSDLATLLDYMRRWLRVSGNIPDVVNISMSGRIPAAGAVLVNKVTDLLGKSLQLAGITVVASAGNDGRDVDAKDCLPAFPNICWEEASRLPCETAGVMCVGGLADDANTRDPDSNFGSDPDDCCTVDIYGPYTVWTTGDPSDGPAADPERIRQRNGTSYASPFVAGVAAQVLAADPSLSARQVQILLEETAHTNSPDDDVPRWVDAEAAVRRALGGDVPPYAAIVSPSDEDTFTARTELFELTSHIESNHDIEDLTFEWTSDKDGVLATTQNDSTVALETYGDHIIELTVSEPSGGFTVRDSVLVEAVNETPEIEIVQPSGTSGITYFEGETIDFKANSSDLNVEPDPSTQRRPLDDAQITWESSIDGALGSGHTLSTSLSIGTHIIEATATDDGGETDTASVEVVVDPAPANSPPSIDIVAPYDGKTFEVFTQGAHDVTLEAEATDPEDGVLDGSSIVWTTDRTDLQDADLGTGSALTASLELTGFHGCDGFHTITAEATDSEGESRRASIEVCVYFTSQ